MKDVSSWLQAEARRQQRIVWLEDALLGSRFRQYAVYRLRYFLYRYLAASLIHAVRFLFLLYFFPYGTFLVLLLAHSAGSFASSFWWGGLEAMRLQVRRLHRSRRPHLIPAEIARWLGLATFLSAATMLAAGIWLSWQAAQSSFGPAELYGLTIFLRLATELWTRCLHSGIYALRRIYRPVWAIVATDVVGFGVTAALWPWFGAWSLGLGTLGALVSGTAIVLYYTLRTYRLSGLLPLDQPVSIAAGLQAAVRREFAAAGLSFALMRMDAVLVLALFSTSPPPDGGIQLFVLFFIMIPTVQAGFDWAQLFYFDLKRLEVAPLASLRARYERSVAPLAWVAGVFFGVLGCLIATASYQRNLGAFYPLLLLFFVSRALLAERQVRLFADSRYAALFASAVLWLTGFLVIRFGTEGDPLRLLLLSLLTAAVWASMRWAGSGPTRDTPEPGSLTFLDWLHFVTHVEGQVRLGWVQFARDPDRVPESGVGRQRYPGGTRPDARSLADRMARRLGDLGAASVLGDGRVVWCERADRPPVLSDAWILTRGGGLVQGVGRIEAHPDASSLLETARRRQLFGTSTGFPAWQQGRCPTIEDVRSAFARMFPGGLCYAPDRPTPAFFEALPAEDRRAIMTEAITFARELRPVGYRSAYDVTALCLAGELRLIFAVPAKIDPRRRSRWRRFVTSVNVQAAVRH